MGPILGLNVIDGTAVVLFSILSIVALTALVVRRRPHRLAREFGARLVPSSRRWFLTIVLAAVGGAVIAVITLWLCESVFNVFGLPLDADTHTWVIICFAATAVAVVSLVRGGWMRRVGALLAAGLFVLTAALGINAAYGMNATVAEFLNISVSHPLAIPRPTATPIVPRLPLYESWKAPAGMPAGGSFGTVTIPATKSGFVARPAWLYLPPAALVTQHPALPVLIMMMGQPGGPESSALFVPFLNSFAAAHHGLAPIVLTVDQIGNPYKNPLCIDSPAGHVYTYLMRDVVSYVSANLPVAAGPHNWAIGGYSNGGECALAMGSLNPDVFGSIADISGELRPSLGSPAATIQKGFQGSVAAYTAALPVTILAAHHYADTTAVFTWGGSDPVYGPEGAKAVAAARAAGMSVTQSVGPGVGHRADAVTFGFPKVLAGLAARWSLEAPSS